MNRGTKAIPSPASDLQIGEVKHVIERVGTLEWDQMGPQQHCRLLASHAARVDGVLHRRTSCVFYP